MLLPDKHYDLRNCVCQKKCSTDKLFDQENVFNSLGYDTKLKISQSVNISFNWAEIWIQSAEKSSYG